jgi:hypothetical protein
MSRRARADRPAAPAAALAWGSYRAAEDTDLRLSATTPDGSGDYHHDTRTAEAMRRLSRSADRNAAIVAGPLRAALRLLIGNEVGPRPRPVLDDAAAADALAGAWMRDACTPRFDADGSATLLDLLTLAGLSYLRDGDVAAVHDGVGASVLVEADRILSPAAGRTDAVVVQGVEFAGRRRAAFWIADYDRNGRVSPSYARRYDAEQVTFAANWDRAGQTRGVPVFAACLDDLEHLDSLAESEIRSAENASTFTGILKRTDPTAPTIPQAVLKTRAGTIIAPPQGYEMNAPNLGRPNLNVPEFQRLNLRIALMTLGLPLELLLLDLGSLNYAASRSLRNLAEHTLHQWRSRMWRRWLDRTWAEWATAQGFPDTAVEWEWPRLELHDRNKEAEADATELANGTTSLRQIAGPGWRQIAADRAEELRVAAEARADVIVALHDRCAQLNADHPGLGLRWADLLPPLPGTQAVTTASPTPDPATGDPSADPPADPTAADQTPSE